MFLIQTKTKEILCAMHDAYLITDYVSAYQLHSNIFTDIRKRKRQNQKCCMCRYFRFNWLIWVKQCRVARNWAHISEVFRGDWLMCMDLQMHFQMQWWCKTQTVMQNDKITLITHSIIGVMIVFVVVLFIKIWTSPTRS